MNFVFYSARDENVLQKISAHIDARRKTPPAGPCDAVFVFITGDAGTGKTMMQDGLKYLTNITPVFAGSTNVAGNVLKKVLTDHQFYANDHTVYSTSFQQTFKLNPTRWKICMKRLYQGLPSTVLNGSPCLSAVQFYTALWPNLQSVCKDLVKDRIARSANTLSPENYSKFRRRVVIQNPSITDPRAIHTLTMTNIMACVPRTHLFDQLIFDTYVMDEAGRLASSWAFITIGLYYVVHEMYDTGVCKPTMVVVGSCTQSSVINDTCMEACETTRRCAHHKVPLNDYSMITMITKDCLIYPGEIFVKNNKHNRRTNTGNLERSANLAVFRNCLETGEPVPMKVMKYIRSHMSVTKEEFYNHKCIHLCMTHEDCSKVLKADVVDPSDIIRCEESMTAKGTRWPDVLYYCSANAGAMYKSANYVDHAWVKQVVDTPQSLGAKSIFNISPLADGDSGSPRAGVTPKYSRWTATRNFYKGRPYNTTHSARCSLAMISGSCEDFLRDMEEQEHLFEDSPGVLSELIKAMATTLSYSFPNDAEMIEEIVERASNQSSVEDLMSATHDLRCLMCSMRRKSSEEDGPAIDMTYMCDPAVKTNLFIPSGTAVCLEGRIGHAPTSPLKIRLGHTLVLAAYSSTIKISQLPDAYQKTLYDRSGYNNTRSKQTPTSSDAPRDGVAITSDGTMMCAEIDLSEFAEEEADAMRCDSFNTAQAVQIDLNEGEAAPPPGETGGDTDTDGTTFTVLDIFPYKLALVSTVAAAQGITISTKVYGQIKPTMDAYNMIVMSTRCSSSDHLFFYFEADGVNITPLDQITAHTIRRLFILSNDTTGNL